MLGNEMNTVRPPAKSNPKLDWTIRAGWLLPIVGLWSFWPGIHPTVAMGWIAISFYLFLKTQLLLLHCFSWGAPSGHDIFWWYAGWPGLNAAHFFDTQSTHALDFRQAALAIGKIVLGSVLLLASPKWLDSYPLIAAWQALIGLLLMLHFGLIHLLAVVWRMRRPHVTPIMNSPLLATTVSEFWSKRWNLAFRDYAHLVIFRQLNRRFPAKLALVAGFLFSGFVHEVAISFPAHGGWGLPTLYFVIQALALLLERPFDKSWVRLRGRWTGRLWCFFWLAVPAPLLFHPPFLTRVVLPIVESLPTWSL